MSFQKIYGLYGPNYPADIFTPSCLDPHWPAGHLRSKHISYSWYDGKSSYDGTPSYDDFPSYENFLFGIWWIAIILTIQCMMELHHIMMLIHHKLYDSYKLYYCQKWQLSKKWKGVIACDVLPVAMFKEENKVCKGHFQLVNANLKSFSTLFS